MMRRADDGHRALIHTPNQHHPKLHLTRQPGPRGRAVQKVVEESEVPDMEKTTGIEPTAMRARK